MIVTEKMMACMKEYKFCISVAYLLLFGILLHGQNPQKIDSLKVALDTTSENFQRVRILIDLTDQYINNMPDQALIYGEQAYELAKDNHYSKEMASSLVRLAKINLKKTNPSTALELSDEALKIAEYNGYDLEKILALRVMGYVHADLKDSEKSAQYFFESLKLSEEFGNKPQISKSLISIGYSHFSQRNMEQAIDYFQRALVIAREVDEKSAISAALNNLSSAHGVLKDSVRETSYLLEAIEINKEIGQWYFLSINYLNRGLIFKKGEMYDSAMFYYHMAADLAEGLEDNELLLDIKCYMGRVHYSLGDLESLRLIASEVFEKSELFGLKKKQYCAAQMLDLVYRRNNDFEEAYKFAKIASSINDSLRLANNNNELEKLELQAELARHEQELSMQGQRRNYFYIIAGIVLLSFLGFLSSLVLRHRLRARINYLERDKYKSELDSRNKEFTIHVMSLMKKNELLKDLSHEIMEIEKDVPDDKAKGALKRVSGELIKVVETQISEEFELRFKDIHSEFYQNLIEIAPDITTNEQKLCAFLRLHMTTKEISILTGQSTKSIEQARYRLRKKLNITGTDANLIRYLSKL